MNNVYETPCASKFYRQVLDKHILKHGFHPTDADPCLFINQKTEKTIFVLLAMDDFLVAAEKQETLDEFAEMLRKKYTVKYLGVPKQILNWDIITDNEGQIHVSQASYIQAILDSTEMKDATPRNTPLPSRPDFDEELRFPLIDDQEKEDYQPVIG